MCTSGVRVFRKCNSFRYPDKFLIQGFRTGFSLELAVCFTNPRLNPLVFVYNYIFSRQQQLDVLRFRAWKGIIRKIKKRRNRRTRHFFNELRLTTRQQSSFACDAFIYRINYAAISLICCLREREREREIEQSYSLFEDKCLISFVRNKHVSLNRFVIETIVKQRREWGIFI